MMITKWLKLFTLCALLLGNTLAFAQPCSEAGTAAAASISADMPDCHITAPENITAAQELCAMQSLAEKGLSDASLKTAELPDLPQVILTLHPFMGEETASIKTELTLASDAIDINAPPIYLTTQRFRI